MKLTFKIIAATIIGALSVTIHAQSPATGQLLGHGYVDLGLSVVWATCNIGAESPSEYGDYFAWGEAETKSTYTESNSTTHDKSDYVFFDAAAANWGSRWRMPTSNEIDELINRCTWEWTSVSGHHGYKATGPNGKSIFLPAAGQKKNSSLNRAEEWGYYWESTPGSSNQYATCLFFREGDEPLDLDGRYLGRTIRPVADEISEQELEKRFTGSISGHDYVDLGLSVAWATCNIGASSPEDYGNYYAWGEAQTKTKYTKSNSTTYKKSNYVFRDAATVNWGFRWRMPTDAECEELVKKCTWGTTSLGGIYGFKVTGPNGRSIFFPAGGDRSDEGGDWENRAFPAKSWGCFWSSSPQNYNKKNDKALELILYIKPSHGISSEYRFKGLSIRPVTELNKTKIQ